MTAEVVLECSALHKAFATKTVIEDFSFEVRRGEIVGLLGPNGAGKTTLIRMILDLLPPDRGQVRILGEPLRAAHRDRLGYLPEERGLYKKGRLAEVLEYLVQLRGLSAHEAHERVAAALEELGFTAYAKRRVMDLSKGMAQRAQFVAASAHRPLFMVMDEPFSGLDPVGVQWALQTIRAYRDGGATILLSAHQMAMVERLCDRVVMVHRGRRVLYGTLDEVRAAWPMDRARVECAEDLSARPFAAALDLRRTGPRTWDCALHGEPPAALLARLLADGVAVEAFQRVEPSLEDVFLEVVGGEPELPREHA